MSAAFYRICQDGQVYPAEKRAPLQTLYYIETCLIPEKTTASKYEYYTSFVQDSNRQRVPGNVLEWNGVKCRIEELDKWEIDSSLKKKFGIDGIVLVAHITDSKGTEERMLFDNESHNGQAWIKLMAYVRDVCHVGSHRAVDEAKKLRLT